MNEFAYAITEPEWYHTALMAIGFLTGYILAKIEPAYRRWLQRLFRKKR